MRTTLRSMIVAAALGAATAPIVAAVVPAISAQGAPAAIEVGNFTFNPQKLTVKAGTTVTWTNKDDIRHAIAAVSKQFKSKALDAGDTYSFTFITPGTFKYFCSIHPRMTGTIVVEATTESKAPN